MKCFFSYIPITIIIGIIYANLFFLTVGRVFKHFFSIHFYSLLRYEILKKSLAKEEVERNKLVEKEKNDAEIEQQRQEEVAFLSEEQKAIQKEQADQTATKRIIDKMMVAPPHKVNNVVCELLANFKGNIKSKT